MRIYKDLQHMTILKQGWEVTLKMPSDIITNYKYHNNKVT